MKRNFAVALLMMSFASLALADGSDIPPRKLVKPPQVGLVQLADGSDIPPKKQIKPPTAGMVQVADGSDIPPKSVQKPPRYENASA
jgi:hypothetical protein